MTVNLTANFFKNARGVTLTDGGGITWSINKNTNAVTGTVGTGGANAANPTAKVGPTVVNGVASTWMRSDAAPPIDLTASYAWTGNVGWFGAVAIAQPTTLVGSSVFVQNAGTAINSLSTFDGYTVPQIVKALRTLGLLA
ncbi:MAG TPA: hypothetical protein VGU20_31015 [Stellaceae bacterium]|nr:hypothetical protein [Terriglobia bacterium]HEV2551782.1 hypothetical protein [Stellaceae bacterium]